MKAIPLIDGTDGARLPVKPTYGLPCNGCGWCCASEPCGIAREFIGADGEGPCPAQFEKRNGLRHSSLTMRANLSVSAAW